ncbi:malectin-B [Stomoxys calcitrans]|uniref:malectin-B n=1 Tax=Stomoxys calcitrans TaxID=35570 RepID=UPI0027E24E29|nr:malectin-B [Stomoxys calcitrans]
MDFVVAKSLTIKTSTIWRPLVFVALLITTSAPGIADAAVNGDLQVIYAVNAGGYDHTDKHGIVYESDPLNVGTASDYGNHLLIIGRVPEQDEVLYRTERYHTATFGYDLPLEGDGNYALMLKFCEVYFNEPNMKVFDVVLNRQHEIVSNLDIFAQVGRGTAHDEYIFFSVSRGKLHYKDEVSDIRNNVIRLDFIKGAYDNPKINAFALFKGDVERIPRLMPIQNEAGKDFDEGYAAEERNHEINAHTQSKKAKQNKKVLAEELNHEPLDSEEDETIDDVYEHDGDGFDDDVDYLLKDNRKNSKTSGPRQPNPYTSEDSMVLMPVFVAIGCFIPLLFCLCKL